MPRKALACPECGADEKTGWSEDAQSQHLEQQLDLPDDKFDYDEFVKAEFGQSKPTIRPRGIPWLWWIVGVVLLGLMLIPLIMRVLAH